jgi:hypothetical protein
MMRPWLALLGLALAAAMNVPAQTSQQLHEMPSSAEFLELVNKADEKVEIFDATIKSAAPFLDDQTVKEYREAASNCRLIIRAIRKNGMSNFALLGLVSTLDDLTLDSARASRVIILAIAEGQAGEKREQASNKVMALMQTESSLYDISELILHAGFRFTAAEDDVLESVVKAAAKQSPTSHH